MTIHTIDLSGEHIDVLERMIVAPAVGVFRPLGVRAGTTVAIGDVVGVLERHGTHAPVRSAFAGTVMGVLAHDGERLRAGQPVAWMRVA